MLLCRSLDYTPLGHAAIHFPESECILSLYKLTTSKGSDLETIPTRKEVSVV